MWKYALKRTALFAATLLTIAVLVFVLTFLAESNLDPASIILG